MEESLTKRSVVLDVIEELRTQADRWGGLDQDDIAMSQFMYTVLQQLGRVSEYALHVGRRRATRMEWHYVRGRMVTIAAVCIAYAEAIDRRLSEP